LSKVITLDEVRVADYNLSPSQFVEINGKVQHRLISEILEDLAVAKVEREEADVKLENLLSNLLIQDENI
jgi:type I restriction enzyme M protein